ncbi:uncharacterized protein DFL_009216 [Arthrobotrys flagrans]|uniref:Uncharacterized protein n=1 Tax=Arthrobotrys flagrans TaxID=97331 RepID=A0A436ZR02_ARTFL|nr:hypothetical protein DFL_009216 [Arthrobotrys flagrans]
MGGSIKIVNATSSPVQVFVSTYNGGSGDWYTIHPISSDIWYRGEGAGGGWELVAFRNDNDTTRIGKYVKVNSTVIFVGFDNLVVT